MLFHFSLFFTEISLLGRVAAGSGARGALSAMLWTQMLFFLLLKKVFFALKL